MFLLGRLGRLAGLIFLVALTSTSCASIKPSGSTTDNAPSATAAASPTEAVRHRPSTVPSVVGTPAWNAADGLAPSFGPVWGDRTVYHPAVAPTELEALDGLAGASEYRIDLIIDASFTHVAGWQQVHYTNRETVALDRIFVRLFPNALGGEMSVSEIAVDGVGVQPQYQFERTAVLVPLPRAIRTGESIVLSLKYQITVPETLETGYGLISYTGGILALDTPYAAIPVFDDEGWNVETPPADADTSYNDASFYLVRVTAPDAITLVATGTAIERETRDANQTVTFAHGPARDFFIAGSTRYVLATQQVGETQINSYAPAGEEKASDVALDAASNAVRIFSRRFGPYPYKEFDVAATPMLALGIEYPGAVGISERVYDPRANAGGRPQAEIIESTVAHEVAHQWFYNLVGNDQIDEPWLDEAFAQYATWLYYVDRYDERAAEGLRTTWESRWDRVDRKAKSVGLAASEYEGREYSAIVYGRGPLFLAAVAGRMGQATFDQFLSDYAARFRWEIATTAGFKSMAEEACGCELDDLYHEWLDRDDSH